MTTYDKGITSRFLQAGTSAQNRTVQDKLQESVSVKDFGAVGNGIADDTVAIQAAIDASYGKILHVPKGEYKLTAPLVIQPIYGGVSNLPLTISGQGFDANGGNGSTIFRVSHTGNCITIDNTTAFNADARFLIEGLVIVGDGVNSTGGDGIYARKVSCLILKDLFVFQMRGRGIYFERCYGSIVEDCILLNNRQWGFYAEKAFNLGNLRRVRAYGNGRFYSSGVCGNIRITGTGDENLGVQIENVDVSYAGNNAYNLFQRSDSTLTNIVVLTNVATVTTLNAHGLVTGYVISLVGATVATGLNTTYPVAITVTGTNTFTFATTGVANGTYTESTIVIGPGAYGFFIDSTRGLVLQGYSEDSIGPALYMGASVRSFKVEGGYWQGAGMGCILINDSAQNGCYDTMYLNGSQAKLIIGVPAGPHNVNVCSSNTYGSSASVALPSLYMQDGTYYGPTAPATGTWAAGAYIKRSNPVVGGPKGWYCTLGGTPGTWVSEGNL